MQIRLFCLLHVMDISTLLWIPQEVSSCIAVKAVWGTPSLCLVMVIAPPPINAIGNEVEFYFPSILDPSFPCFWGPSLYMPYKAAFIQLLWKPEEKSICLQKNKTRFIPGSYFYIKRKASNASSTHLTWNGNVLSRLLHSVIWSGMP